MKSLLEQLRDLLARTEEIEQLEYTSAGCATNDTSREFHAGAGLAYRNSVDALRQLIDNWTGANDDA